MMILLGICILAAVSCHAQDIPNVEDLVAQIEQINQQYAKMNEQYTAYQNSKVKVEVRAGEPGGEDEEDYSDEGSLEAKEYFVCTRNAPIDR